MMTLRLKLILGAVGLGLLIWGGLWARQHYIEQGRTEGKAEQAKLDETAREQERVAFEATLKAEQVRAVQAELRYQEAVALVRRLNSELDSLRSQIVTSRQAIERVSDDQLFADVRAKIGMVPPTDTAPFTAPELREIDVRVTEHPLLTKQVGLLEQKIKGLESEVAAQSDKLRAVEGQRDAAISAYNKLTEHYVAAYTAIPKKNRSVRCLWLWKCGTGFNKLQLPDPVTLTKIEVPR